MDPPFSLGHMAMLGTAGACLGTLYEFITYITTENVPPLAYDYVNLQHDPQLIHYFGQIERIVLSHQRISYFRLINAVDELIGLKLSMMSNTMTGQIKYMVLGQQLLGKVRHCMKRLLDEIDTSETIEIRDVVRVRQSIKNIKNIMDSYIRNIISRTKE